MMIDLTARHVAIDEELRALVQRKLAFALDRFPDLHDCRIAVRFVDVNAHRGGRDKFCHIEIGQGLSGGPLVAEATEESVEASLVMAVDRLAKRLRRGKQKATARRRRERVPVATWYD